MIGLRRRRDAQILPADFIGERLIQKHLDLVSRYFDADEARKPMTFAASKWKSAKTRLRTESDKKCAYCEAPTSTVAHGDVEHFRPKSVYWWLAYTFDNYLFACQICNQIYKGDHFPVTGGGFLPAPTMPGSRPTRAADLRDLAISLSIDASVVTEAAVTASFAVESADLINPCFEDPEPFIWYEADDSNEEVWMRPADGERAHRFNRAATDYLGLNREELRRDRYVFFEQLALLKYSYDAPLLAKATKNLIEKHFRRCTEPKYPYAGMHRYYLSAWGIVYS